MKSLGWIRRQSHEDLSLVGRARSGHLVGFELPLAPEQELVLFLVPPLSMGPTRLARIDDVNGRDIPSRMNAAAASSPLAVEVNLANRLVRPDRMAFLRASARAFAASLMSYKR